MIENLHSLALVSPHSQGFVLLHQVALGWVVIEDFFELFKTSDN